MNYRMVLYLLGKMMKVEAFLLLLPLTVSLIYKESNLLAFIIPIAMLLVLSCVSSIKKPKDTRMYAREGFVICALTWIVLSVFGALPFVIDGCIPNYIDAFFETVSGFTTTGSSIMTDVENLTNYYSINFWRTFTHWVGGMGILVLMLAVLPNSNNNSMHIIRAEMPGPKIGKLVSKMAVTARILYGIYMAFTVFEIILLCAGGMPIFDSILNTFSTAGTGGFGIRNAGIGHYNSPYIEYVISAFMILFGINFNVFYFLLIKRFKTALTNEEVKTYFIIIIAAVALITLNIYSMCEGLEEAFRLSLFQVGAVITTTGFATANFSQWPMLSQTILWILMFIGACAGSTGGGIKVSRIIVLIKQFFKEMRQMISPRTIQTVKIDKTPVDSATIKGIKAYFFAYIIVFFTSILLISINSLDFTTTVTSVTTCLNNIGPGLGNLIGPVGNFSSLSVLSKLVLSFDMLAGRLELFPILILFAPGTWRKR